MLQLYFSSTNVSCSDKIQAIYFPCGFGLFCLFVYFCFFFFVLIWVFWLVGFVGFLVVGVFFVWFCCYLVWFAFFFCLIWFCCCFAVFCGFFPFSLCVCGFFCWLVGLDFDQDVNLRTNFLRLSEFCENKSYTNTFVTPTKAQAEENPQTTQFYLHLCNPPQQLPGQTPRVAARPPPPPRKGKRGYRPTPAPGRRPAPPRAPGTAPHPAAAATTPGTGGEAQPPQAAPGLGERRQPLTFTSHMPVFCLAPVRSSSPFSLMVGQLARLRRRAKRADDASCCRGHCTSPDPQSSALPEDGGPRWPNLLRSRSTAGQERGDEPLLRRACGFESPPRCGRGQGGASAWRPRKVSFSLHAKRLSWHAGKRQQHAK